MKTVTSVEAIYTPTGVRRFDGNPFIEALPPLPAEREDFLLQLSNYPEKPTDATRKCSEVVRLMELSTLKDVVFPFPEYKRSAIALATDLRDTYVARNPLSAIDIQRRHALATSNAGGLPFPSDWKSSAQGHALISITGMGKTTFCNAFLLRYPQLIKHTNYHGHPFLVRQVVHIVIKVPHDATLRGLCIQFFEEIDRVLGSKYREMAVSQRTIALMVALMHHVATTVSLAMLIIDDVQNLRVAIGKTTAQFALNLFSEIVERLGVSLFLMSTPSIDEVLINIVRNTRKSTSSGCEKLTPMGPKSAVWKDFCNTYWDYMFVKNKARLTSDTLNAWYRASAGDTAFAVLAFMLTQRNAIGGKERVDDTGFERTMATDMAVLQPAISALRSRNAVKMKRFEDLLFSSQYRALSSLLDVTPTDAPSCREEFDEVGTGDSKSKSHRNAKAMKKATARAGPAKARQTQSEFPTEDPLSRDTA